jgi:hypothetical protein
MHPGAELKQKKAPALRPVFVSVFGEISLISASLDQSIVTPYRLFRLTWFFPWRERYQMTISCQDTVVCY